MWLRTKIVDKLSLFEGKRSAEFIWYQSSHSMILEHLCLDTKVAHIYVNMLVRSNWTVYHYLISTAWLLQDLIVKPRYLITFTVGQDQKKNIDAAVKKVKLKTSSRRISPLISGHFMWFSATSCFNCLTKLYSWQRTSKLCCFTTMAGQVNGMNTSGRNRLFTWVCGSKLNGNSKAIAHVLFVQSQWLSVKTWAMLYSFVFTRWYAKRFLHPDIVAPYDYIFIWDEDLGVENFNPEEWVKSGYFLPQLFYESWDETVCWGHLLHDRYIKLVRKHGLDISQPGLSPDSGMTWQMTRMREDTEVHKYA